MLLRPRQKEFVERSLAALKIHGNALGVAPTGAGKTILFSEIIGRHISSTGARTLVLAHRDELTSQNQEKFKRINPSIKTSIYDAKSKSESIPVTLKSSIWESEFKNIIKKAGVSDLVRLV